MLECLRTIFPGSACWGAVDCGLNLGLKAVLGNGH